MLAGILALTVLVVGFGTAIVLASLRKDKESEGRERGALLASLGSHAAMMERALTTAEEEGATLRALSGGDLATVHRRFGTRLNDGFGFEFVYITDAKGNIVYSSERGQVGEKRAYEWIRPAIARALTEGQKAAQSGLVAGDGAAGLMVVRPFEEKALSLDVPQPLIAVTVDVIDPDFLKEVSKPASLQDVQLVQSPQQAVTGRRVFVPNLSDGSEVELVWRGAEPGRGLLRELMPVATVFALLLAGIFLVLMVRAQRTASALSVSEARVRELAQQDYLTGLVNRGYFLSELDAALAARKDGGSLALLFVDLDGFKEINDGAGHGAGDEILRAVARLLRDAVGENGLAGRFGGDEFVVLARLAMPGDLDALAARIFRELRTPVQVEGEEVYVSASVGAARAPDDANSAEELMRLADIALYRAKAEGRGTFRLFEPRFESQQAERRQIAIDLAAALHRGELKLLFQPQVELASERITGFEALVRWDHPAFGRLQPSEFVPVAEDSNLITALDIHVLRRACLEAHSLGGTTLAVNMSPVTLRTNGILQRIMDTLRETGFDPLRLEIEITESAVLQPSAEVQRTLEGLRAAGVRLALDDFGTGYASVVHVRRFPITKIKIDKSFIFRLGEDPDAAAIVEYKVRLGRSLGLVLTAEGVETPDQLRFLRAIGTDEAQGYLFAPPLPLAAAVAMLERQADALSRAVGETSLLP